MGSFPHDFLRTPAESRHINTAAAAPEREKLRASSRPTRSSSISAGFTAAFGRRRCSRCGWHAPKLYKYILTYSRCKFQPTERASNGFLFCCQSSTHSNEQTQCPSSRWWRASQAVTSHCLLTAELRIDPKWPWGGFDVEWLMPKLPWKTATGRLMELDKYLVDSLVTNFSTSTLSKDGKQMPPPPSV